MIRIDRVSKVYGEGPSRVRALDQVSLEVARGEFVSLMGPSGSGKSTVLNLVGGLDTPTSGEITIDGRLTSAMTDDEITLFRRRRIGFVFQFFNLLPTLSTEENVMLPLLLDGRRAGQVRQRARDMLALVGLVDRLRHKPTELSGGEMQRVAIARALVTEPALLLADEPTGNLDSHAGEMIMTLIRDVRERFGQTILLVTHDARAAAYGTRVITLKDGRVVEDAAAPGMTASGSAA